MRLCTIILWGMALFLFAAQGHAAPPQPVKGRAAVTPVRVLRFADATTWAVSPQGDFIAVSAATRGGGAIQIYALAPTRLVAAVAIPGAIGWPCAIAWSPLGRRLAVCGKFHVTLLQFDRVRQTLSTGASIPARWNTIIFSRDEKTLFGYGCAFPAAKGETEKLYQLSLTMPNTKPTVVTGMAPSPTSATPLIRLDDGGILLAGAGVIIGPTGAVIPAKRIGSGAMYDAVVGIDHAGRHPFVYLLEQPFAPKGPYSIMVVSQTRLIAQFLDNSNSIALPWPRKERINELQCAANHHLFAQRYPYDCTGILVIREYQIALPAPKP